MDVQKRRVGARDPETILAIAAEVLSTNAAASLADVAAAAGVGRTTLHNRFPTREALLLAVAHDALDHFAAATQAAGLAAVADTPADLAAALRRLVEELVPLGARVEFLVRQPALDKHPEIADRLTALDRPVEDFATRCRRAGVIRRDVPAWWVVSTLYALTYSSWEAVATGKLAPRDATSLTLSTILHGLAVPS